MSHTEDLQRMKDYLAERFHASGDFSVIDPKLARNNPYLSQQMQRGILLRRTDNGLEVVLYCHAAPYPGNDQLLAEMLGHKNSGRMAGNVLYSGEEFFRWDKAPFKGHRVGSHAEKSRQIKTRELERLLNGRARGVTYFKPDRNVLERVKFIPGSVTSHYDSDLKQAVADKGHGFVPETERQLLTVMNYDVEWALRDFSIDRLGWIDISPNSIDSLLRRKISGENGMSQQITAMLHTMPREKRQLLTRRYGAKALGNYAVE